MNAESANESKMIPYSGRIIGGVVDALDIRDEVLIGRTAKRYYSGVTVTPYSLKQIYITLGKNLVELGIVPAPLFFEKHSVSMVNITAASIARLAKNWDKLCATIQSRSGNIQDYNQAFEGFSRMIVIDLALRIVAWYRLAKISVPEPTTPRWAEENGAGKMLRGLLSEAGITRDQFSARVGVTDVSIDNWFDGKIRPVPSHIEAIAGEFAKLISSSSKSALQVQFQRQFTLTYLADILARNIGRAAVVELATALYRFTWLISEDIRAMNRPPIEEVAGLEFEMLRHGTDEPLSHTLLRNLAWVETDPVWKKEILAATTGWDLRFEEIAGQYSAPGASAGLAQELPDKFRREAINDGTEDDLKKLKEASSLRFNDYTRIISGDLGMFVEQLRDGINYRRLIVSRHPLRPQAHQELGSFLGMAGKHLHSREMINEGINECKIAATLCDGWDTPLVEPGIILINIGRYEEALIELEAVAKKLPVITPHLAMNRGYALMQTGMYEQALSDFEFVIRARSNFATALDYAAHCAFITGDQKKGMEYAKDARKFGEVGTYNYWQAGKYRKKAKKVQGKRE